jgi:hypothetical protein
LIKVWSKNGAFWVNLDLFLGLKLHNFLILL